MTTATLLPKLTKKKFSPNGQERCMEICRIAAKIIHDKGYDATSMDDIAKAVNLTKAGLYYYIESKQDLLYKTMIFSWARLEREVVAPMQEIEDPEARLRFLITEHGRIVTDRLGHLAMLSEEENALTPKQRREVLDHKRSYYEVVRDTLEELKQEGKLKAVNTTVATFSLFGMILWLPRWFKQGGKLSSKEAVDEVLKMALGGVLKA